MDRQWGTSNQQSLEFAERGSATGSSHFCSGSQGRAPTAEGLRQIETLLWRQYAISERIG